MTHILLFDSIQAAQEAAHLLRGHWDQCNGVALTQIDEAALRLTTELLETKYYGVGKACALVKPEPPLDDASWLLGLLPDPRLIGRKANVQVDPSYLNSWGSLDRARK